MSSNATQSTPLIEPKIDLPFENPAYIVRDVTQWLNAHWGEVAIAFVAALAIYLILNALRSIGKRFAKRGESVGLTTVIGRAIARTSHPFMALAAARLVMGYANPPDWLASTIAFLFTVVAAFQVALWLREIVLGLVERHADGDVGNETLANAMGIIRLLVSVALFAIAVIVVLDNVGVNVTGLVAGLGIGGIAIGLAAQGIFADLFAALSIIFDKPFRKGETIAYDSTTATVEKIGLKTTRMRALTGEKKIISNTQLLDKELTSYAGLNSRRIKFAIGVIYQTDPGACEAIPGLLQHIVEAEGQIFVRSGFVGFGASSLDFELEFDTPTGVYEDVYQARHRIGIAILRAFNEKGLEFAYPTQTTFTAAPDGAMIMPYPHSMAIRPPDDDGLAATP